MNRCVTMVGLALGLSACGGEVSGPVGEFSVQVQAAPFGLSITHPSGLALKTAPKAAGVRAALGTYEMQFGSFLIEELNAGPWQEGLRLTQAQRDDEGIRGDLVNEAGDAVARLDLRPGPGGLMVRIEAVDARDNRSYLALECDGPDAGGFLGFGAHTDGIDHRGEVVPVWVSEQGIGKVATDEPADVWFLVGTRHQSYLSVPTLVAPRAGASYGLHNTTLHRSIWDLCATDPNVLRVESWQGRTELMISPGPTPLDVVQQQTALNGRIPKAPDWTFGVWMEAIGGEAAVREEVARLLAAQIPASAIWSEDWRGGVDQGRSYVLEEDWRWDRALYPGLPALIADLEGQGLAWMSYFNTFVVQGVDVFSEARDGGHLVQDRRGQPYAFQAPDFETSHLADLFAPQSREWVKGELRAALDLGTRGWMADFAEWYPADPRTVQTSDGRDAEAAHHQYPLEWAVLNREAVAEAGADDVVIFHRSGYSGSQGQAHVVWAGDQRTSFDPDDGLPSIVPLLLGLSAVGFPVVTHDIAGYVSATNPPTTKELFLRWTSLGAMAPVMRTHHGRDAALNWRWSRDEATVAHFRRWADLHTQLFPLWAGLGLEASQTGAPILRPLAFFDPTDPRLSAVSESYMVGDGLLVAPVVTSSTTELQVVLPKGRWFDFFTHQAYEGGQTRSFEVPVTELVLLARAGAVVPMLPAGVQSLRPTPDRLDLSEVRDQREVRLWLGASGEARDVSGGRWALSSPAEPQGAVKVQGGQVLLDEARHLRVRAAANHTLQLTDDALQHELRAVDLPEAMQTTYDIRW